MIHPSLSLLGKHWRRRARSRSHSHTVASYAAVPACRMRPLPPAPSPSSASLKCKKARACPRARERQCEFGSRRVRWNRRLISWFRTSFRDGRADSRSARHFPRGRRPPRGLADRRQDDARGGLAAGQSGSHLSNARQIKRSASSVFPPNLLSMAAQLSSLLHNLP